MVVVWSQCLINALTGHVDFKGLVPGLVPPRHIFVLDHPHSARWGIRSLGELSAK